MGNQVQTETQQAKENIANVNKTKTQSNTSETDIKSYFNTKFPVVISQEVFDIRYVIIPETVHINVHINIHIISCY